MRWSDEGIFLTGRPHGETSAIAEIFTRMHGRTLGLVKGGRSRRIRPLLQMGNGLKVEWRARLDDQLGVYTVELSEATAARVLDETLALSGVAAIISLLLVLPERDPHPGLYDSARDCLLAAGESGFPAQLVRFELRFLEELGFGLDLSSCAATGRTAELVYVSPKTGHAVTREAGEPYKEKLLRLPSFLIGDAAKSGEGPSPRDIADGLSLTGYFLEARVFSQDGLAMPKARDDFLRLLPRHS